jgi:hypothetical protein
MNSIEADDAVGKTIAQFYWINEGQCHIRMTDGTVVIITRDGEDLACFAEEIDMYTKWKMGFIGDLEYKLYQQDLAARNAESRLRNSIETVKRLARHNPDAFKQALKELDEGGNV